MTTTFEQFTSRLGDLIRRASSTAHGARAPAELRPIENPDPHTAIEPAAGGDRPRSGTVPSDPAWQIDDREFNSLARELFALQFEHVGPYRGFCRARRVSPESVTCWSQIPAVPTSAFKELDFTSLPPEQRTHVFHSSGTTRQIPSRHFHNAGSLAIYEASLLPWFQRHLLTGPGPKPRMIFLAPSPALAPHSSLAHLFETVRRELAAPDSTFVGGIDPNGAWVLDVQQAVQAMREAVAGNQPVLVLGTAFSFVHLIDHCAEADLRFPLPNGSRVMETGGYKGRSRSLPKAGLHSLITERLGVPASRIVCEYGMSELSSQAYDRAPDKVGPDHGLRITHYALRTTDHGSRITDSASRPFHFPPWARAQIISTETGREVSDGETGLIRIFDLANVRSVMAIQTEDLGIRRANGFELIGRATLAEPRGCSLMAVKSE